MWVCGKRTTIHVVMVVVRKINSPPALYTELCNNDRGKF